MKSVLVVDDEQLVREFAAELLEEEGFRVKTLESADAAYSYLQTEPDVQILLTDVRMPGSMDGAQLASKVCDEWPHIEVILMSGYESAAASAARGTLRFLPKPWSIGQLLDAVEGKAYSAKL